MAKKNTNKEFNFKLYAVIVFFAVLAALVAITYTTYTSRYIALHPDRVAENFVDTIVQNGDGYNAYKSTVASKNMKYGDFIRKYYINPVVYRDTDYEIGGSTDGVLVHLLVVVGYATVATLCAVVAFLRQMKKQ